MAALISLGTPDVADRFAGWDGSRGSWLAALPGLRRRTDDQVFTAPAVAALSRLPTRLGRRPLLIPTQLLEGGGSRVQLGPEQGRPGGDELTAKCCGQDVWTGTSPGYPSSSLAGGEQSLLSHHPRLYDLSNVRVSRPVGGDGRDARTVAGGPGAPQHGVGPGAGRVWGIGPGDRSGGPTPGHHPTAPGQELRRGAGHPTSGRPGGELGGQDDHFSKSAARVSSVRGGNLISSRPRPNFASPMRA